VSDENARRHDRSMNEEATYVCDSCGEEIVIPIDLAAGAVQEYVEDCPVCCHPNVLLIELDESGAVHVRSHHE
jgi:hypothetical protein